MRTIILPYLCRGAGILGLLLRCAMASGQADTLLLAHDEHAVGTQWLEDRTAAVNGYEPLNGALGGDSVRLCNGYACVGWVEDRYPDGVLKHRGYYNDGQLIIYKNYHPDGTLEREFRSIDNLRCVLRTYHGNGTLRSETKYFQGRPIAYADHYPNGQLRYQEERHKTEPYYLRMDLYAADGKPISLLQLVDRKHVVFEQREYHPNGLLRETGRARYDPGRGDSRRVGTWIHYDPNGRPVREERYVDGRVQEVKDL